MNQEYVKRMKIMSHESNRNSEERYLTQSKLQMSSGNDNNLSSHESVNRMMPQCHV